MTEGQQQRLQRNIELLKALQEGDSIDAVAERFGLTKMRVMQLLGPRKGCENRPARAIAIMKALLVGESHEDIARRHRLLPYNVDTMRGVVLTSTQPRPDTSTRDAQILAAANKGENFYAIGLRFGICRERVRQIAVRMGFDPPRRSSAVVKEKVLSAVVAGEEDVDAIALRYDVLPGTVRYWAGTRKLTTRNLGRPRIGGIGLFKVIAMLQDGTDLAVIAKEADVPKRRIYQTASDLRRAGVKIPLRYKTTSKCGQRGRRVVSSSAARTA